MEPNLKFPKDFWYLDLTFQIRARVEKVQRCKVWSWIQGWNSPEVTINATSLPVFTTVGNHINEPFLNIKDDTVLYSKK